MKCESYLELLEEYLDGELAERDAGEIAAHLTTCRSCATETAALTAEQELFSRYDRELAIPASVWKQIAERTSSPVLAPLPRNGFGARLVALFHVPSLGFSYAAAAALIVFALVIVAAYLKNQEPKPTVAYTPPTEHSTPKEEAKSPATDSPGSSIESPQHAAAVNRNLLHRTVSNVRRSNTDQSDVLSSDLGEQDFEDQETAKHIEQTQNLLRSIRNVKLNDNDVEVDVSYDKALSRKLLNENIILRRDAEMKAKYPTKMLLSDLEPFLIDIANLPDQAKPEDVRVIKERVQKTEIVAALIGYK